MIKAKNYWVGIKHQTLTQPYPYEMADWFLDDLTYINFVPTKKSFSGHFFRSRQNQDFLVEGPINIILTEFTIFQRRSSNLMWNVNDDGPQVMTKVHMTFNKWNVIFVWKWYFDQRSKLHMKAFLYFQVLIAYY